MKRGEMNFGLYLDATALTFHAVADIKPPTFSF